MKKVAFATFGCRLNQYDTETLRTLLVEDGGWQVVPFAAPAQNVPLRPEMAAAADTDRTSGAGSEPDVVVVNSCTVTARADATVRKTIRRIHNARPDCAIVVTGCYAQRAPAEVAALPGVKLVLGAADRAEVAVKLARMHNSLNSGAVEVAVSPISEAKTFLDLPITEMMEHSRAYVKVQEGCDESCAFCIVPQTRGASRSRRPESVLRQIRDLIARDYIEIVLTGVHLGDYGLDLHLPHRDEAMVRTPADTTAERGALQAGVDEAGTHRRRRLTELITQILQIDGLRRFRLSSIEPASIPPELIALMGSHERFARHFHIPFQSGSDRILERMQRRYRAGDFERLIEQIHATVPGCGIGCDVICGFPGETDADFASTFNILERLPLSYIHPFAYSTRPGSLAETFEGQLGNEVKKRRVNALKRLFLEKNRAFRESHIGLEMEVLVEQGRRGGAARLSGLTDNYLRVELGPGNGVFGMQRALITGLSDNGLYGELL